MNWFELYHMSRIDNIYTNLRLRIADLKNKRKSG